MSDIIWLSDRVANDSVPGTLNAEIRQAFAGTVDKAALAQENNMWEEIEFKQRHGLEDTEQWGLMNDNYPDPARKKRGWDWGPETFRYLHETREVGEAVALATTEGNYVLPELRHVNDN